MDKKQEIDAEKRMEDRKSPGFEIKPDFYDCFSCIADRCPFTCCQEWKIAVDDTTNEVWKNTAPPTGTVPAKKSLKDYTAWKDEVRIIRLNRKHVCPFLDKEKLCTLVLNYGDRILSETCRIFPREIHEFPDRNEYTLMPGCPAVIDFLKVKKIRFVNQKKTDEHEMAAGQWISSCETDVLFQIRSLFLEIVQDEEL